METNKEKQNKSLDGNQLTAHLSQPSGMKPLVNAAKDLIYKPEIGTNSWFVIGHFDVEDQKLNFLYHVLTMSSPDGKPIITSSLAFTNETTGEHFAGWAMDPFEEAEISTDKFSLVLPKGTLEGDLNQMTVKAHIPEGSVDVVLKPVGHVLYNGSIGYFPMLGMDVYQYSLPTLETSGTITLGNKTYEIKGTSWFDRQWQNLSKTLDGNTDGKLLDGKWAWMDLNLDNGDRISLWSAADASGNENSWVTILHPDGNHTVTSIKTLSDGESDYWTSPKSGKTYPTKWKISIPAFDAELEVIPQPREQELVPYPEMAYYEAASLVKGTYKGLETTGYCYVELVGDWK